MSTDRDTQEALRRVLGVLEAYGGELILIGGWVPRLHLAYGRAAVESPRTSLTFEADILIPASLRRDERRPIADLLAAAGFSRQGRAGVVWVREPSERGEVIEFMQRLAGPERDRGSARPVPDQPDLQALSLDHLQIMEECTETLTIPSQGGSAALEVLVPLLGAFVINKANTFHLRGGDDADLKAGKDLLYLRDIMAAGERATAVLEADVETVAGRGRFAASMRRATVHLQIVAPRYHEPTATILAERDGLDLAAARADVQGHLADLTELLASRSTE